MRVGWKPNSVGGLRFRLWGILALVLVIAAGCSSDGDERVEAEATDADRRAAANGEAEEVFAAFDAWAKGEESEAGSNDGGTGAGGSPTGAEGSLDGVIEQFNRKVRTCWKQPFGMPRLATVRLLVQFNPDGTVRKVSPRPEAAEAVRYRTEAPYLVMIAQTSRALRQCQPYLSIRQNYAELSQLEMVVDPRMFRN